MKKKLSFALIALILVVLLSALYMKSGSDLSRFLSESHEVDANILVIEGWLPDAAIEMIKSEVQNNKYDLILTAGIQSAELDFCMVAMNGYLIFYPAFMETTREYTASHLIEVTARSKMGGIYKSHFNFYVNDSLVGDFNADEKPQKFGIQWNRPLTDIDSIAVQFTNDMVDENGDRNLYVKEITIDNQIIIPYQYNSVFDIGLIGGTDRIVNDYESHPEVIRNKLIEGGIDSSRVVAITGKRTDINRTLVSALAVRKWLRSTKPDIAGINIVSMGIHSRRTWLTYRKVLGKSFSTGVISLPGHATAENGNSEVGTIGETLDLVYYNIILLPYMFN